MPDLSRLSVNRLYSVFDDHGNHLFTADLHNVSALLGLRSEAYHRIERETSTLNGVCRLYSNGGHIGPYPSPWLDVTQVKEAG